MLYLIGMGLFLLLICNNINQVIVGGLIIGFFAGILSQIEANTRK